MTERLISTTAAAGAGAPVPFPGMGAPLAPDARALVDRASRLPNGLALLLDAPLECAAVLLEASPRALERLRAALEDPHAREEALEAFARAAAAPSPAPAAAPQVLRDPEALLAAARSRPEGLALLLSAAVECAAIVFRVHPQLVLAARDLARQRGLSSEP